MRHLPSLLRPVLPTAADCGQPEFTAPGLVSLSLVSSPVVGPPHLHQRRPAAALFVGDVSPAPDPVRYLQCVRELHSWHCQHGAAAAAAAARGDAPAQCRGASSPAGQAQQQQEQQQEQAGGRMLPPLVVNTHGWVKGMGFDVLGELLGSLPVTHLVQLAAANPKKNLPPGAFWLPDPADGGVAAGPHPPAQPLQWVLPGVGEEGGGAAQPAVSDTSARSAVTGTGGGPAASEGNADGGGRTARGRVHAVEQRALQWEALAQQCADACGLSPAQDGGSGKGAAGAAAADDLGDRLAAAVPYVVDTADLEVQASSCRRSWLSLLSHLPPKMFGWCLPVRTRHGRLHATFGRSAGTLCCALPCAGAALFGAAQSAVPRAQWRGSGPVPRPASPAAADAAAAVPGPGHCAGCRCGRAAAPHPHSRPRGGAGVCGAAAAGPTGAARQPAADGGAHVSLPGAALAEQRGHGGGRHPQQEQPAAGQPAVRAAAAAACPMKCTLAAALLACSVLPDHSPVAVCPPRLDSPCLLIF